ncbi:hypothetical protein F1188_19530 [Roseospira marina]|uniref:Uncharacterized protein n=1 Tax=Roseospira marina TaxID=140057 RepID=A0A5M6I6D2_9PROT|nr:hypothetical protein [Roseospira marina]KAA5603732.1 hypothetical protein F1188_19530 [Roseospira marina]MBB4316108.1 hypothetical protein [Roseospira marina]MBB5089306.1 hypothetical protein [Roseospira marina]
MPLFEGGTLADADGVSYARMQITNTDSHQNFLESLLVDTDGTGITLKQVYGYEPSPGWFPYLEVSVDNVRLGAFNGGVDGGSLDLIFDNTATIAAINTLVQNIGYRIINDEPNTTRTFRVTYSDTADMTTDIDIAQTFDVTITPKNEAPRNLTPVTMTAMDSVTRDRIAESGATTATDVSEGWTYVRSPAKQMKNVEFGGDTRLQVTIDKAVSHEYNDGGYCRWEGYRHDIGNATEVSAQIYIPSLHSVGLGHDRDGPHRRVVGRVLRRRHEHDALPRDSVK